jgi:hypothetical protein
MPKVEFPLDFDLPTLMLAGLEATEPGDAPLDALFPRLDHMLAPAASPPEGLKEVTWPPVVARTLEVVQAPHKLREVMQQAVRAGGATAGDVARAIAVLVAAKLLAWEP